MNTETADAFTFINVDELSCEAVDVKPIDYDWDGEKFGDEWDFSEASRCEKCGAVLISRGDNKHSDIDSDSDCDGYVSPSEGPMMSCFYPVDIDLESAAEKLVDLPLCAVSVNGKTGLALTGGGMDLSWEICEAFMILGMLPPVHFELPGISGRGTSEKDKWIIAGCRAALQTVVERMSGRIERLDRLAKDALADEKKRSAAKKPTKKAARKGKKS
jgi:hypothetical protein